MARHDAMLAGKTEALKRESLWTLCNSGSRGSARHDELCLGLSKWSDPPLSESSATRSSRLETAARLTDRSVTTFPSAEIADQMFEVVHDKPKCGERD